MPTIIDLPGGNSAVLRNPESVTRKQRLPVEVATIRYQRAMLRRMEAEASVSAPTPDDAEPTTAAVSDEEIDCFVALEIAAVLCMVESWSFGFPVDADGYDQIPAQAADVLGKACMDAKDKAFFVAEPSPDPESPTQPSSD